MCVDRIMVHVQSRALQLTDLNNLGSNAGNIKKTILYKIHVTKNNIRYWNRISCGSIEIGCDWISSVNAEPSNSPHDEISSSSNSKMCIVSLFVCKMICNFQRADATIHFNHTSFYNHFILPNSFFNAPSLMDVSHPDLAT